MLSMIKNFEALGFSVSADLFGQMRLLSGVELKQFYKDVMPCLKEMVGADKTYLPMYPNFPQQVMEASDAELIINALPNKKLVGYTVGEQARDIILPLLFSLIMFVTVYAFGMLSMRLWIKLPLQIVLGITVYVVLSLAFRVPAMHDALKILAKFKSKKEKRETEE